MFKLFTYALLASAPLVTDALPNQDRHSQKGLDQLSKKAGKLYFGTAADIPGTGELQDKYYMQQYNNTKDFGQTTPANAMKWMFTEPQQNVFNFTDGDLFVSLAKSNKKILRCHALVWHQQAPEWVTNGNWTKPTLLAAIDNHVRKTLAHFGDNCYAWDVVNEALDEDGTYRKSLYYNVTGTDYIATAFRAAQETVKQHKLKVKLYYNDYNIETPGNKSSAAAQIVKNLKAQGIKVNGVGLQSHFTVGGTPSTATQKTNMESFTKLGVEVAITELDIRTTTPVTEAAKQQQVLDYANTTAACTQVDKCVGITLWDFVDTYSWIPSTFPGQGYGSPWFQEAGEKTPLTRKMAYDGIVTGLTMGKKH
ncbi:hypothetical protein KVT40_003970 [Elsinoe batatas]|uniref:Beta-xylanase n=1 Tax=Elsinoe batatas TaxID=2601811 RepID=A0A8K0PH16_9PEZI|nr:hypothetical protein KVT40_003970 [Elsinoe batatas]